MLGHIVRALLTPAPRAYDPIIQAGRLAASLMPGHSALDVMRAVHVARIIALGETRLDVLPMRMEASAMGPMNERLYADLRYVVRMTGAGRPPATVWERTLDTVISGPVERACAMLAPLTSAQIVAHVQRPESSWALSWMPDAFSQAPIGDPARWRLPQRSVTRGAVITIAAMLRDHATMFEREQAA